jgi:sugar-specific transcriptional regulator TrmB
MQKNLNQQITYSFTEDLSEGSLLELQLSKHQVLIDLGLTQVQARVYLALVESGPSRIMAISKISKVARPEVYANLSKLQELGLIEKIIKMPLTYRAIPMNKGLTFLLKTKTEQYKKVRAQTRILLDTAKMEKPKKKIGEPQFVLIPRGRTVIERIKTAIEKAQLSMDFVLSWKMFSRGITSTFAESMEVAWAKNVKIRIIVQNPLESKTVKQLIEFCRKKPFCQIRFIRHHPRTIFKIHDKKEVFIITNSKTDLAGSPTLWSNNPSLIALADDHFEILWHTAIESTH